MKRRAVLLFILLCSTAEAQDPPINAVLEGQYDVGLSDYADLTAFVSIGNGKRYAAMGSQSSGIVHFVDLSNMLPIGGVNTDFDLGGPFAAEDVAVLTKPQTGRQFLIVGLDSSFDLDDVAIYDIRDPFLPVLVTSVQANINQTHNLFVHTITDGSEERDYLFVCNNIGSTVSVYDLTDLDPDNPPVTPLSQEKWTIVLSASSCAGCGAGDAGSDDPGTGSNGVHDMTAVTHDNYLQLGVNKELLYVAAQDGVWVYDITNMATVAPVCMGMIPGTTTQSVSASQDGRFVVATESRRTAFSPGNGGMRIYSQQDRSGCSVDLVLVDEVLGPTGDGRAYSAANAVVTDDGFGNLRVYASWTQAGLQVYDIDPITGAATAVAEYDTSGSTALTSFGGNWGVHPLSDPNDPIAVLLSDEDNGMFAIGLDCDNDLVNDATAIVAAPSLDCPGAIGNGIPDTCESDCQNLGLGNGVADSCDIAVGTSVDITGNGIPDECEADCNNNSFVDSYDLAFGLSQDCNANGVPDECDGPDCDGNGNLDECDIRDGASQDCNGNSIPDTCDVGSGNSEDCNDNLIPDECEADCNSNTVPDECDIATVTSLDINFNLVPDECEAFKIIYVDDDAPNDPGPGDPTVSSPTEDGSSTDPFDEIQEALDATVLAGNVVIVMDGTYTGPGNHDIQFPARDVALVSLNGPGNTVIDCQQQGRAIEFDSGNSNLARVHGFSIVNAKAPPGIFGLQNGGGIYFDIDAAGTISNCIITNCIASAGAGVYAGPIFSSSSVPVIKNCVITGNITDAWGAGVFVESDAVIQGCTIVKNMAAISGGGIAAASGATATITNCIVWDNDSMGTDDQIGQNLSTLVTYSAVQGGFPGIGNISRNPQFLDLENGDYRLVHTSPCVNSGDRAFRPAANDIFDVIGQKRLSQWRIDMGAVEAPAPGDTSIVGLPTAQ